MSPFVIYNAATGVILRTGFAPVEDFESLLQEGEAIIGGAATVSAHYIDIQTKSVVSKKPNPSLPERTVGKVGELSKLVSVPAGSRVVVRSPGGAQVAVLEPTPDGEVTYTPEEEGRHAWEVSNPALFPVRWFLDVIP